MDLLKLTNYSDIFARIIKFYLTGKDLYFLISISSSSSEKSVNVEYSIDHIQNFHKELQRSSFYPPTFPPCNISLNEKDKVHVYSLLLEQYIKLLLLDKGMIGIKLVYDFFKLENLLGPYQDHIEILSDIGKDSIAFPITNIVIDEHNKSIFTVSNQLSSIILKAGTEFFKVEEDHLKPQPGILYHFKYQLKEHYIEHTKEWEIPFKFPITAIAWSSEFFCISVGLATGYIHLQKLSYKDLSIFESVSPIKSHSGIIITIIFIEKQNKIISIGTDQHLVEYNSKDLGVLNEQKVGYEPLSCMKYIKEKELVIIGNLRGIIYLFDCTNSPIQIISSLSTCHSSSIFNIIPVIEPFSLIILYKDSYCVYSKVIDSNKKLISINEFEMEGEPSSLLYIPENNLLVSTSKNSQIKVKELKSGNKIFAYCLKEKEILCSELFESKLFITGGSDKVLKVINLII